MRTLRDTKRSSFGEQVIDSLREHNLNAKAARCYAAFHSDSAMTERELIAEFSTLAEREKNRWRKVAGVQ